MNFKFGNNFSKSFNKYKTNDPSIISEFKKFRQIKRNNHNLPSYFKEHFLDKPFTYPILECHLSHDILLLYTEKNDTVHLLEIIDHEKIKRGSDTEFNLAKRYR